MIDFKRLRAEKSQPAPTDPAEIFRRLPKAPGINDLYSSQAQVLQQWYQRRTERDIVIKLHTGGGKTLVGLLVGLSVMNDCARPVIYLVPTVQLVKQTIEKATQYSVPAVGYQKGADLPSEFYKGNSILVCTYQALFNGNSKFGVRGGQREIIQPAAIILDDAHVAFSAVREAFTLSIAAGSEGYRELSAKFRKSLKDCGKGGTFDDVVEGKDPGILEVPYWAWLEQLASTHEFLKTVAEQHPFVWPLIRDHLPYCHALISRSAFTIAPILPLVDMIPTFSECPHRVYMSATISDDSAIVRAFDADPQCVSKPITSKSLAGVNERMILVPELTGIEDAQKSVRDLVTHMAKKQGVSTVILVPSHAAAEKWRKDAVVVPPEEVSDVVSRLQSGADKGPFVFVNRYDGIDLPGEACRILIVEGLPRGISDYDQYRANVLAGGAAVNNIQAQRVEQGLGRAARGSGDYAVVIATGKDLVGWLTRCEGFLTSSTRAQLDIGVGVSRQVKSAESLVGVIQQCLRRDRGWIEYHADALADLTDEPKVDEIQLQAAGAERKAFELYRHGYHEKAIRRLESFFSFGGQSCDRPTLGWMKQLAARIAADGEWSEVASKLQQDAYADNSNLHRPKFSVKYVPPIEPSSQARAIVQLICSYSHRKGLVSDFDESTSKLTGDSSANQFEQALCELGSFLGFSTQRPDNQFGKGPDVLWLMHGKRAVLLEAKSRRKQDKAYGRDEHGQLLNSIAWFQSQYSGWGHVAVSVHPSNRATKSVVTNDVRVLTLTGLSRLVSQARATLAELCESLADSGTLEVMCESALEKSGLVPNQLCTLYFETFKQETGDN